MGEHVRVDDPTDERLADYVALTDTVQRRRVERDAAGRGYFIVEGTIALRALLASRYEVRSVLIGSWRLERLAPELMQCDAPVYHADAAVLEALAGYRVHRGVLASACRPPLAEPEPLIAPATTVLVAENISDHENLGALFRNAAAFGVDVVLLSPRCADPLYRRSVRVSLGHVLRVPYAVATDWSHDIETMRRIGFRVLALTPRAGAAPLGSVAVGAGERAALLVGSEGEGLTAPTLALADELVRIPMAEGVDSLNLATAAAIALYHLRAAAG